MKDTVKDTVKDTEKDADKLLSLLDQRRSSRGSFLAPVNLRVPYPTQAPPWPTLGGSNAARLVTLIRQADHQARVTHTCFALF